jgi:hypothetical protein
VPNLALALFVCLALLAPATARAESPYRVALIEPDTELLRAVSLALEPWGVETIRSDVQRPEPSQPEAAQGARSLAEQLGVEGVVWVTSTAEGSLLWVYDLDTDEVTTRMLDETPPFDSAAAAAVALSIKTVLRSKVVEQREEPVRAPPPPPPPPPPPEPPPPEPERAPALSALELGGASHWAGPRAEPRLSLKALAWLAFQRRFGIALSASGGPGLRVDDARFRGRYREVVAGAQARVRLLSGPSVSLAVALGGALHWSRLEGTVVEYAAPSDVRRLNGSLDLDLSADVVLTPGLYLGASATASYLPTHRRYLVEGTRLLSPGPFGAALGGHIGVELF